MLLLAAAGLATAQDVLHARCVFQGTGVNRVIGQIDFIDNEALGCFIEVSITEAAPGSHGVHVHSFGDLSDGMTGTATGPHYNPYDEIHGCYPGPRKVGDMGNVVVDGRGAGTYVEVANFLMRLRGEASVVGRGAIFHDKEDNCVREEGPGGDLSAGARTAQCIIGLVAAPDKALEVRAMVALRDAAARKVSYSRSGNTTLIR